MPIGRDHDAAVAALMAADRTIRRYGFAKAVGAIVAASGCDSDCIPAGFVPDAFKIDSERHEIVMFEVEDSRPVTSHKLSLMAEFWESWDGEGQCDWMPTLVLVDRQGATRPVNLAGIFASGI